MIGIRDMFDGSSLSRDRTFTLPAVDGTFPGASGTVHLKNSWFDTLTGRIGYSFTPAWLWYFQGGAAWAKNSADVNINGFQVGSADRTRTGWTVGGGVEWMFAPHWSAFLEGNYMDFGSTNRNIVAPNGTVCAIWLWLQYQSDRDHRPGRRELQIQLGQGTLLSSLPQLEPTRPRAQLGVFLLKRDGIFGVTVARRSFCFHENSYATRCPLLAQSGHAELHCTCPLSAVKRTSITPTWPPASPHWVCSVGEGSGDRRPKHKGICSPKPANTSAPCRRCKAAFRSRIPSLASSQRSTTACVHASR